MDLQDLIDRKGLSFEKLAKLAKVSVRAIRYIRSGLKSPRTETVHRLAKALGVEPRELRNALAKLG